MNRSALTAAAGAAGALILVGALAAGYDLGRGQVTTRTVIATVTRTATVTASPPARPRHHRTVAGARSTATSAPQQPAVLYTCTGQAITEPVDYTLTCGAGGENLNGLTWAGWGGARATASGQLETNDCTPDCAQGTDHYAPVKVIASDLLDGYYSQLDITGDCAYGCAWTVGQQGPGS